MTSFKFLLLCSAMLLGMGQPSLRAATLTWDADTGTTGAQDGGGLNWLDASRWWNGAANVTWSSGNDAVIGSATGAAGVITLGAGISAVSLTFNAPGSGAYTLTGGTLDLTSGNIVANASATIESVLNGTAGLNKSGAGTLTLAGGSANTFTGVTTVSAGTLTLNKTAGVTAVTGNILVNGGTLTLLANNQVADNSDLVISSGTVTFGGRTETIKSISMTGGTFSTGNSGGATSVVTVSNGVSIGGTAKLTVNSGGTFAAGSLALTGTNIGINAADGGNILIGGSSASAVTTLSIGAGGLSMSGQTIQFNSATGSNKGSRIELNGDFTGTGTNTIALSGTSSGSAISELSLGSATRTFNIISGTTSITGISVVGSGGSLVKAGSGQLSLLASNTYTGATIVKGGSLLVTGTDGRLMGTSGVFVSGGTFQIGSPTATSNNGVVDRVNTAASITLGGSEGTGALVLAAAAAGNAHSQTLSGLVVSVGANTVSANAATGTNTLTFSGSAGAAYTRNAGGYVDFGNQVGFTVNFSTTPTGASVSGTGSDAVLIGATMNARKDFVTAQSGVITAATYTATGTTAWDAGKNMNVTGDVTTGGADAGINSLRFAEAAARTISLTGTQTIASGMILVTSDVGNNATLISGGTLRGSAGGDLLVSQNNTGNALTISSTIVDNGSATSLTKVGTGLLVLTADNSYTGSTYLLEGVLRASEGLGLGDGNLVLGGGVLETSGTFSRALGTGVNQVQITGGVSGFSARDAALTVNIGGAGATLQWGSTFFNPSTFVLNASTANNTLELVNGLNLNGSTRNFNVLANTATISGVISNSGDAGPNGAGLFYTGGGATSILRLTADNTYTGRTLVTNGTLSVLRDQNLGILQGSVVDSIILATGGRLRAESTFTLDANRGIGIGSSAGGAVTGVIEVTAGNTFTVAGVIANRTVSNDGVATGANTGALTKVGAGTLALSNANTYSGVTTVSNGVLDLRHNNALGTSTAGTTVSTGAALQLSGGLTIAGETLSIIGTGVSSSGALRSVSGNNTWTGAITITGGTRINSDLDTLTLDVVSGNAISDGATTGTTRTLIFGGAGDIVVVDGIVQTSVTPGVLNLTKDGIGTVTLKGTNVVNGTITASSGRLVLDYSSGAVVLPTTSGLNFNGGTVEVKGGTVTLGNISLAGNSGYNKLVVGASTSLTLGSTWARGSTSVMLIDLSAASSAAFFTTPAGTGVTLESKGIDGATQASMIAGGGFAAFTVKDANGRYDFAARDSATGAIIRLNAVNALPTTGGSATTAYRIKPTTGSTLTTLTGNVSISTLRVEATDSAGSLDLAGFRLSLNDLGLLYDGDKDFTINDSSVTKTGFIEGEASGNKALFIYHYGTGKLTLNAKLSTGASSSIAFIGEGGLIDLNAAANINGNTHVEGVVVRVSDAAAMTLSNTVTTGNGSGYLNLSNGGILELTGTDFTRGLSSTAASGKFGFFAGDGGGFSAFGADRFVDIKVDATVGSASANITWGSGGFLVTGAKLILGSKYADHQVDFRNNIDLNNGNQVIDVQSTNAAGVGGKLSGVISSASGSLQKIGQGILEVTGNNIYGGGTTVKEGTFLANNTSGSATGLGDVTVLSGARLGGNGTVGTTSKPSSITVKSGGTLSVGQLGNTSGQQLKLVTSAAGVITLSGTVEFDIFGNNGGVNPIGNNDSLGLTSSSPIALGGTLKIVDSTDLATELTLGSSWQLIDWTNVIVNGQKYTGAFTTFDVPVLAEGLAWDYSQLYTTGYVSITVVPEPGRVMLLAGGLAALLMRRRRRTA